MKVNMFYLFLNLIHYSMYFILLLFIDFYGFTMPISMVYKSFRNFYKLLSCTSPFSFIDMLELSISTLFWGYE